MTTFGLQRDFGNVALQRLLFSSMTDAGAGLRVQRCGPTPCDCSADDHAQASGEGLAVPSLEDVMLQREDWDDWSSDETGDDGPGAAWSDGSGGGVATDGAGSAWTDGGGGGVESGWSGGGDKGTAPGDESFYDKYVKPLIEAGRPLAGGPIGPDQGTSEGLIDLYDRYIRPTVEGGSAGNVVPGNVRVRENFIRCVLGLLPTIGGGALGGLLALIGVLPWKYIIDNELFIETMCACLPDEALLDVTRGVALPGRAARHFDHYLQGSGESLPIDVHELVSRDAGVRERLVEEITRIGKKQDSGSAEGFAGALTIRQGDYTSPEWQFAYGTLDVNFDVDDSPEVRDINSTSPTPHSAMVNLSMYGIYDWHPQEERSTKCIHAAAERMKAKGARDFFMDGSAVEGLQLGPALTPTNASAGG